MTKEWVGLTVAEIKEIVGPHEGPLGGYTCALFNRIDAKLKEKNGFKDDIKQIVCTAEPEYAYVTYGTAYVELEAGKYTLVDLKQLVFDLEQMNEVVKKTMDAPGMI